MTVALLAVLTAACGTAAGSGSPAPALTGGVDGALRLGTLLPVSGRLAAIGPGLEEAVRMAVADLNAAGGVLGRPVTLAEDDSGSTPEVAAEGAQRLRVVDGVDAIVGPATTPVALAVLDVLADEGGVACSPSASWAVLRTADTRGQLVRTVTPDPLLAPALAAAIAADGRTSVALLAEEDRDGRGLLAPLRAALAAAGIPVAVELAPDPTGVTLAADVAAVVDAGVDAVVVLVGADVAPTLLRRLRAAGVPPDLIYTVDGVDGPSVGEMVRQAAPERPSAFDGLRGVAPASQGSTAFLDALRAFSPLDPVPFAAHAYDCAVIIALAVAQAGSDDPARFAPLLSEVTRGGERCTTPAACLEIIARGGDPDYDGASGPLELDDAGDPSVARTDRWEVSDGLPAILPAG